jgi:hypothetical protein
MVHEKVKIPARFHSILGNVVMFLKEVPLDLTSPFAYYSSLRRAEELSSHDNPVSAVGRL